METKEISIGDYNRILFKTFSGDPSSRYKSLFASKYPRIFESSFFSEGARYATSKCIEYYGFDSLIRIENTVYFTNGDVLVVYRLHSI
jgi:hypothetical protein